MSREIIKLIKRRIKLLNYEQANQFLEKCKKIIVLSPTEENDIHRFYNERFYPTSDIIKVEEIFTLINSSIEKSINLEEEDADE